MLLDTTTLRLSADDDRHRELVRQAAEVMAAAAAAPGAAVAIPKQLAADISECVAASTREQILEIRRREWRGWRAG